MMDSAFDFELDAKGIYALIKRENYALAATCHCCFITFKSRLQCIIMVVPFIQLNCPPNRCVFMQTDPRQIYCVPLITS